MKDKFMCYAVGDFLFLFSLADIRYILPEEKKTEELHDQPEAAVINLGELLGLGDEKGSHALLLECEHTPYIVSGGQALGLVEAAEKSRREVPYALALKEARCLTAAVFLEERQTWAYIADSRLLYRLKET